MYCIRGCVPRIWLGLSRPLHPIALSHPCFYDAKYGIQFELVAGPRSQICQWLSPLLGAFSFRNLFPRIPKISGFLHKYRVRNFVQHDTGECSTDEHVGSSSRFARSISDKQRGFLILLNRPKKTRK